jgi:hypothetical protein
MFRSWLTSYDDELLKGSACDLTPLRVTFDLLVKSFIHEGGSLNLTLLAYPAFQLDTEEVFKFSQIVGKMVELTRLPDHEAFKKMLQQWRAEKAPMKLFTQDFLTKEHCLVTAAQSARTSSGIAGTSGLTSPGNAVNSLSIEVMNFPHEEDKIWKNNDLDTLEAHYMASCQTLFGTPPDDSLIQSVKNLLTVREWIFVQIPATKGFLRYCYETIGPGIRRFSGTQDCQTSWMQFWDDWKKKIHCIHPRIASNPDKLKALVNQLDSPAREKASVYIATSDDDGYWKACRDLFFIYGNVQQQKQQTKALLQKLRPTDITSAEKNDEFFDQVKKLNLKLINLGMSPDRVGEECMTVLINNLNPKYLQAFYMEARIGVSIQDTFYMMNAAAWYLRFSDWFNLYIRTKKRLPMEREGWDPSYMFHQLAAPALEQHGAQIPASSLASLKKTVQPQPTQPEAATQAAPIPMELDCEQRSLLQQLQSVLATQQNQGSEDRSRPAQKQQPPKQSQKSSQPEKPQEKKENAQKRGANNKKAKRTFKCKFCESAEHTMSQCPLTIEQKIQACLEKEICSNCLFRGHTAAVCRKNNQCTNCAGDQTHKHMTLLCQRVGPGNQGQPTPNQGANAVNPIGD